MKFKVKKKFVFSSSLKDSPLSSEQMWHDAKQTHSAKQRALERPEIGVL